jgi:gluconolactonase
LKNLLGDLEAGRSSSSGIALDPRGRVVFCSSGKHAVVRIEADGRPTILAQTHNGKRIDNPNDLTIKSNGSIYFTDNAREETRQLPPTVYLLKDGKLTALITDLVSPNGITMSPDGKVLYVNDIRPRKVYRYDVLPDDTVANGRLFIDMSGHKEPGSNDGMKTDQRGNLYDSGPGGVWIISPQGKHLGTILTPDRITNLGFGGPDGKTLFLTAHASLFRIRLKAAGQLRP